MEVGVSVREARERHGLTQRQLAYRVLSTQQAISRIERGTVAPTVEMLERIAAALGEQVSIELRPRAVPFEDAQLHARAQLPMAERLALSADWNRFAGEIQIAGAAAREQR